MCGPDPPIGSALREADLLPSVRRSSWSSDWASRVRISGPKCSRRQEALGHPIRVVVDRWRAHLLDATASWHSVNT